MTDRTRRDKDKSKKAIAFFAERGARLPKGTDDEEDRFVKVAASPTCHLKFNALYNLDSDTILKRSQKMDNGQGAAQIFVSAARVIPKSNNRPENQKEAAKLTVLLTHF